MAKKRDALDDFDGEYIGNMWGWKFSFFSLAMILVLSAVIAFRYFQTGEFPMPEQYQKEQEMAKQDSLDNLPTIE